jgi:DNA-binding response OmpR family regulator
MKGRPIRILLIEDSPTDALLFTENLQSVTELSFQTDHAEALNVGIEKLAGETYDAIILDLGLPDSSGLVTFESVKKHARGVPIIIMSGTDDRYVLSEAMQKGADNYLIKDSVDGNRIAIAILSAIRNRHVVG